MSDIEEEAKAAAKPKRTRWLVLAFIIAAFFVGCPLFYMSGSVDGRIVDAETGKPVANAHIVGIWQLEGGLFEHAYLGPLHFEETVTDTNGRYHLDGFALRLVMPNFNLTQLEDHDPIIYIFAEGYRPIGHSEPTKHKGFYRKSSLNGKDVAVHRMEGITKDEASKWDSMVGFMKHQLNRCDLLELPQTLDFLKIMQAEFKKVGSKYLFTYDEEYVVCK